MEIVYIETTIVSLLVARTKEGTLAHQWQVWTRDWWRLRRPYFECSISPEVLREAAVDELAEAFLAAGPLPQKAKADAVHLAFAAVYKINYLLTWNFKHLANAVIQSRLQPVAEQRAYRLPIVCTPLQL